MSINLTDEIEVKTKKGKLGAAEQIFLKGDIQTVEKEIQDINSRHNTLNTKHESLSKTVQGIAATGGASTANNVIYNNDSSGLNAENTQDAIDELANKKTDKDYTNAELNKKFDKASIVQELGEAEDKVISQKVVSDKLSDLPKTITYGYNDFKISGTGVYYIDDQSSNDFRIFGTNCSATRLINIRGCKKIILTSKTDSNILFKPFGFYDITGNAIYPEYYFNNFSGYLKDKEIIVPSDAEYVEFRSLTSFLDFKAELVYETDNFITFDLNSKNNEDTSLINSLFNDVEIKINEDSHRNPKFKANAFISKYIFPKCTLKDIYVALTSNEKDITIYLYNIINGINDKGFYAAKYDSYTISKEDIIEEAEGLYKIDKEINFKITKNNTLIGFTDGILSTTNNYNIETGYWCSNKNNTVVKLVSTTSPVCFRATIITKESNIMLSDSIKNINDSIQDINTSFNSLQGQIKEIESSTANVANINDGTPSNSETYSSQKIEERIAEIQNASANVQIVNAEGNSTTNGISQAAATLGLKKRMQIYKSVADMIADRSLSQDAACKTLGYYSINDGGGAEYYITEEETTEDGGSVINLSNGLKAKLISDFTVYNVLQWGWTNGFGYNGVHTRDITDTLTRIINHIFTYKLQNTTKPTKIFIPNGMYSITSTIPLGANIILKGNTPCSYAISTGKDAASLIITNFKGVVFEGSRFYLRDIGFINIYNSTLAENDVWLCNAPKEIRGCCIRSYDYVAKSFVSVAEMCHCVCWLIRKSVVSNSMVDSIIHHNLITGLSWNTQQNCKTYAFRPAIMNACAISDNYIDFFTYGIAPMTEIRSLTIQNNVLDYMPKPIVLSGCMNASIIGNRFYHISKQFVDTSNGKYPYDSIYRTTDWDCITIGSAKSVAIMGNCFDSCDTFLNGAQCSELHIYGNLLNNGSLKTKYAGTVLNSTKIFVDDIEN